ncbi:MAG: hypothetical protein QNJ34_20975 [Xenococcaceae cyanobacterium MO_188.B29]|nr:hypothetical protein [Xenococcaceae cyanobacterium MO_188.B29]
MIQAISLDSKDKIMAAFSALLADYQQRESKVETKEEEAEKEKNQQLLAEAANYTVDNIVNSMASLQLDFGNIINELKETLTTESDKLGELNKAIAVEQDNIKQLRQVRLIADALHILRQEHQEKIRQLEEKTTVQREAIAKEMAQLRKAWTQEQTEFEIRIAEEAEILAQRREQQEEDYQYELARHRQIETDDYEENQRQQEIELTEIEQEKEKDWAEREKYLTDHQTEFEEHQQQIAGFEDKLKEEYNKAKGEAIKEAERKAKVQTDLLEKEWSATQQGYELKLQSLEANVARKTQQINELTTQLQEANTQAQNLALRAFNSEQ